MTALPGRKGPEQQVAGPAQGEEWNWDQDQGSVKPPPPEACPGAWQAPLLNTLVVEHFILLTVLSSQSQLKSLSSSSVSVVLKP